RFTKVRAAREAIPSTRSSRYATNNKACRRYCMNAERPAPPTLFEWAGGMVIIEKWIADFYVRLSCDPDLAPVFAQMHGDHPAIVAEFIAEVLGGPDTYSRTRGGHPHMVTRHLGRHLTQEQRSRWMQRLFESADSVGLPADPEFRSAIVA